MNSSENAGSSWMTRMMVAFSSRMISHSIIAVTVAMRSVCPTKHPSPKNPRSKDRNDCFFPLLGNNGYFDLALLDVENSIRRLSLREDSLILLVCGNGSAAVCCGEKRC